MEYKREWEYWNPFTNYKKNRRAIPRKYFTNPLICVTVFDSLIFFLQGEIKAECWEPIFWEIFRSNFTQNIIYDSFVTW